MNQKTITLLLVAIVALLAAVVGVIIYQNANAVPDANPAQAPTGQTATPDTAATGNNAQGTPAPPAEFDPATAPKVPEGQTPEQYVTAYYQACIEGDYETAFGMLPTATAASYGDSGAFAAQVEGYGVSGFSVDPQAENGDTCTVQGYQQVSDMSFGYLWTFVKGDNGTWLAQSRDMAGMK